MNFKKSYHLVLRVVIELPFEGSRQNRRWKRVPQVGSRGEETITELINSMHWRVPHNNCGQVMPDAWNVAEPLEVKYRKPIRQRSDQSNRSNPVAEIYRVKEESCG